MPTKPSNRINLSHREESDTVEAYEKLFDPWISLEVVNACWWQCVREGPPAMERATEKIKNFARAIHPTQPLISHEAEIFLRDWLNSGCNPNTMSHWLNNVVSRVRYPSSNGFHRD